MNHRDELRMRRFERRLRALEEAALAARPRRKRPPAPRPDDGTVAARERLWARYIELEMRFGHGRCRLTKLAFAMKHRLNPGEFCRFFSATDKRGIPEGSTPAVRFYQALRDAIAELEARAKKTLDQESGPGFPDSHGRVADSQFFSARPQ